MYFRNHLKESNQNQFNYLKLSLIAFLFFLLSANLSAQDSIPEKEDLTEVAELKFQQFFFKALTEKSIGNYQKAIQNLENCNQILQSNTTVFFEFSKNYLLLNNSLLAKEYIKKSLEKDQNNIWKLKHLVSIYQKDRNYKEAIKVQLKIVELKPKENAFLARLYAYNREYKKAVSLINTLEKENTITSSLKRLREGIENRKSIDIVKEKPVSVNALIAQFKTDKSYTVLEKILKKVTDTNALLKFCDEGTMLFPAQPYVYLVKSRILNNQKKHKKALKNLQNGLDFVIDDSMEVNFYIEIAKAYKALGMTKEEKKYKQKALKLKR